MDYCEDRGFHECLCDEKSDGYECAECGYEPTIRELQRGGCPACSTRRRALKKAHLSAWTSLEEQEKWLEEGSYLYDPEAHYDLLHETARLKRELDALEQ